MGTGIDRNIISSNLNELIKCIPELIHLNFFVKKGKNKNSLSVNFNNENKNIDIYRGVLLEQLKLTNPNYIQTCLNKKNDVINLINECINSNYQGDVLDFKLKEDIYSEQIKIFETIISEYFGDVHFLKKKKNIQVSINDNLVTINRNQFTKIIEKINNNENDNVLEIFEQCINVRYIKDKIYKLLKKGITDNTISKLKKQFKKEYTNYWDNSIDKLHSMVNDDMVYIWKYFEQNTYNEFNILKDISIFKNKQVTKLVTRRTINKVTISNNLGSITYNDKESNDPVISFNTSLYESLLNTIQFVKDNPYLESIIKFCYEFYKERELATQKIVSIINENGLENSINPNAFLNSVHIQYVNFKTNTLFLSKDIIIPLENLNSDYIKYIKVLKKEMEKSIYSLQEECKQRKNELASILDDTDYRYILDIIREYPKKGITTYVSILNGDNSSKNKQNNYNKSTSFGKLNSLKKNLIESKIKFLIRNEFVLEKEYKASFGWYDGYTLSNKGIDLLNKYKDTNKIHKIKNGVEVDENADISLVDFFKKLSAFNDIRPYLSNTQKVVFKSTDIKIILDYIKKNRMIYRECEDLFIAKLIKIIPKKYAALFLMNSCLEKGVVSTTFKNIGKMLEEKEIN